MDDGFECYFREKCTYIRGAYITDFNYTLNPLDFRDADQNFDIKKTDRCMRGEVDLEYEFRPDNLINLQEYDQGTDPTLWDTYDDSYFDPINKRITYMSDDYELKDRYFYKIHDSTIVTSSIYWDCDCDCPSFGLNTDPNNPDTDGDYMGDGWEENYGLNPCMLPTVSWTMMETGCRIIWS